MNSGIEKVDDGLDAIVPASSQIEKLAGGFAFTEGPIWFDPGYLLFSDIPRNEMHKWTPDGKVTLFRRPSGYDKNDAPEGAFIGSNGMTRDHQGRLIVCEHGNARVTRTETDGSVTVAGKQVRRKAVELAERYCAKIRMAISISPIRPTDSSSTIRIRRRSSISTAYSSYRMGS